MLAGDSVFLALGELRAFELSISKRIMGRDFDRRNTSRNPAALNAEGTPCQRNGSGILSIEGSTG